jgi:hypothetical protein
VFTEEIAPHHLLRCANDVSRKYVLYRPQESLLKANKAISLKKAEETKCKVHIHHYSG